jgi:3-dehydroquinate dehydratase II
MANILVLHGPNLNLLGSREPDVYGHKTLADIDQTLAHAAKELGHKISSFQSNAEHELVNQIQQAKNNIDVIIINPGAFTHTSIALRDALLAVAIPFIEIHLSNTASREEFRQFSYLADVAAGSIQGFGAYGYQLALLAANELIPTK